MSPKTAIEIEAVVAPGANVTVPDADGDNVLLAVALPELVDQATLTGAAAAAPSVSWSVTVLVPEAPSAIVASAIQNGRQRRACERPVVGPAAGSGRTSRSLPAPSGRRRRR